MLREKVNFCVEPREFAGEQWGMVGWFSAPDDCADTLLVLIPGGTYTHVYWDMPYKPEAYSFVQWAHDNGIATLNLDRLGTGKSHRPPGADLTVQVNADAVDQIIAEVRLNGICERRFSKIVTVGHSFGSLTASYAQATWGNADGVVLTGITGANVKGLTAEDSSVTSIMSVFQRAKDDPRMADRKDAIDDDYYCHRPELRSSLFFRVPPVEAEMVEIDAQLQDTMTLGEMRTCYLGFEESKNIKVPVLVELGEFDYYYMNGSEETIDGAYAEAKKRNPPNFSHAPLFRNAGHNLTQHPNAHEHYEAIKDWMEQQDFI